MLRRISRWDSLAAMLGQLFLLSQGARAAEDAAQSVNTRQRVLPNVILILADDLGYGDLGCFGQMLIQTSHLDKMAAEGMRFTQAYAGATVCAPSRCCLMTGKHGGHAFVRGNKEIKPEGQTPLPADTVTLAHLMQKAGYATGLIGKWGLGYPGSTSTPDKMGFDEFFGYNCQRLAHEYYPPELWRNNERIPLDGKTYSQDLMTQEALGFIKSHAGQPFFVDLSYTIPHQKLQVPDLAPYTEKDWEPKLKTLAAMITRLDRDVGAIFALLKELNIDDHTLVIFASDNGAAHQDKLFQHSGPLRGRKRDLYEGGIRTPAIVRWPGHVPSGVVSGQIWAFWDLLPTLADLTGQSIPVGLDGKSVLASWLQQESIDHAPLYFEFHEGGFHQAGRIGNWKAIRHGRTGPIEIYNLLEDPAEQHNLAESQPAVVRQFITFFESERTDSPEWPIQDKKPGGRQTSSLRWPTCAAPANSFLNLSAQSIPKSFR